MGSHKYDKSRLFHSIRLYVSYLYLQIKHDKTPNSTTTLQLDWLTRADTFCFHIRWAARRAHLDCSLLFILSIAHLWLYVRWAARRTHLYIIGIETKFILLNNVSYCNKFLLFIIISYKWCFPCKHKKHSKNMAVNKTWQEVTAQIQHKHNNVYNGVRAPIFFIQFS